MLKLKKGIDILAKVGGVQTIAQAKELFQEKLDKKHLARLTKIKNEEALLKIANAIAMCEPDKVYVTTGSPADLRAVRKMSQEKGEEKALEITSSTYVMHSGDILYRHCYDTFDKQVKKAGFMLTNVHSEGPNRPEDLPNARVFMDRSWLTTFCTFCTYAGNTLLLKKGNHRFAVDLATYYGKGQELSEHMFITGIKEKSGRITWFVGAAPSGCGKTTTAMVGTEFVGEDLAQMWIDAKGKPHWTGNGERHATKNVNFQGERFKGKTDKNGKEIPISHPNARCTLRCKSIGNYSHDTGESPQGAPLKVVTYSGRDADTMPPVWVGENSDHGVVIGASIVSAATATEVGASGVKRQPWANAPFIPGALADYMKVQFQFFGNKKYTKKSQPILAGLNYFLTDQARGGKTTKLLGEKRDVKAWLTWLARFAHGDYEGIETPIGFIPKYEDMKETFAETIGKKYPKSLYMKQFSIYVDLIQARIDLQREAFGKEKNLPKKLFQVYGQWEKGLQALKKKHGAVVTPDLLG